MRIVLLGGRLEVCCLSHRRTSSISLSSRVQIIDGISINVRIVNSPSLSIRLGIRLSISRWVRRSLRVRISISLSIRTRINLSRSRSRRNRLSLSTILMHSNTRIIITSSIIGNITVVSLRLRSCCRLIVNVSRDIRSRVFDRAL